MIGSPRKDGIALWLFRKFTENLGRTLGGCRVTAINRDDGGYFASVPPGYSKRV
jgi:hypothetical protein